MKFVSYYYTIAFTHANKPKPILNPKPKQIKQQTENSR